MHENTNKNVVLGLSGGVDSAVCAYLLKKSGKDVTAVFMQNWDPYVNHDFLGHYRGEDANKCNAQKDFADAKLVANKLGIKIYYTEFIQKYWDQVFKYLIKEYKKGNTPNPDILCNKYIKFDAFFQYVKANFKCDKIAMGHYARVEYKNHQYYLKKAKDQRKDQTYFLCWLNQKQLQKAIFPIGDLLKNDVRKIAHTQHLDVWNKKDSTGICFIGERKFKDFLQNYLPIKNGPMIDIISNKKIGTHQGIMFYTIGQNKTLGLSGQTDKYYVCKKDVKNNILYVVDSKHKAKYLTSNYCVLKQFNWINDPEQWAKQPIFVRFRHMGKLIPCRFQIKANHDVVLHYENTLSVTNGQFGVLYTKTYCLGGGIISQTKCLKK